MKEKTSQVIAKLPVEVTSFLLNEKRHGISEIESRHTVQLVIVPDPNLETPHYSVERIRDQGKKTADKSSYEHISHEEPSINLTRQAPVTEQPAVKSIHSIIQAPFPQSETSQNVQKQSIWTNILS